MVLDPLFPEYPGVISKPFDTLQGSAAARIESLTLLDTYGSYIFFHISERLNKGNFLITKPFLFVENGIVVLDFPMLNRPIRVKMFLRFVDKQGFLLEFSGYIGFSYVSLHKVTCVPGETNLARSWKISKAGVWR
jgi:hypothetical protein